MEDKVRGLLAYLFGWLGGLIVLVAFKDNSQETKFNACQSIVISVASVILSLGLGFIPVVRYFGFVLSLGVFALQVIGAIKAYNQEKYELPVISDLTRDIFKSQLGE